MPSFSCNTADWTIPSPTRNIFNHPPDLENRDEANYLIRALPTLPHLLKKKGYKTLQTGKYWEGHYSNAGFENGLTLGKPHEIEKELGLKPYHGNGDGGLIIGRRTMQPIFTFIDKYKHDPFFIWYAQYLPL